MVTETSLDEPIKWVGPFGYNKNNTCVVGAITVVSINIANEKVYAYARVAKGQRGWVHGLSIGTRLEALGCYGASHGCWYDARDQYATQEEATIVVQKYFMREFENDLKKAPANSKKYFIKAIEELKVQMILPVKPEPATKKFGNSEQPIQYKLF